MKEKTEKTEKILNIISYTLLILVFIGIVAVLVYHIFGLGDIKETAQYQKPQETLFYPELIDSIEIVDTDTEYYANVYYMDTLVLYTSVEEAESLIVQIDSAYSRYSGDALELEEALGSITDNASITKIGDFYILELDWIKK